MAIRSRPPLDSDATAAAFPLGGIGTGNVSIGARGEFRDWEIWNEPNKGGVIPFTFFAIHAAPEGQDPVTRVLESQIRGHRGIAHGGLGYAAGLPRLARSSMSGEYPQLSIAFADETLPVDVTLNAFTPLVPLDADASGIPGAVLRYSVTNPSSTTVTVSIVGSMSNPVGTCGEGAFGMPQFEGMPTVRYRDGAGVRGLEFGTDLPADHLLYGSAALTTSDESVTVMPQWPVNFWQDGVRLFWDDLRTDGHLESQPFTLEKVDDISELPRLRVGSLGVVHHLAPGETREFEFFLTWHTPNRSRAWNGPVGLDNTNSEEVVRNHYARQFADAWSVAEHLSSELPELEQKTSSFHDLLYGSSLPAEVIDAASSTLATLRSTTCFWLDDGTSSGIFAGWEGSFDHGGSCEGTCTHVWNYAQSVAFLFPELERNARRTEFLKETRSDGRMNFRTNSIFGNEPWEYHPAVDGQMGTIVRLFREWKFSGDDGFLAELWPHATRALDYAFGKWDSNGDFVLDKEQHNTYDIEFHGEDSLSNSMFYAALHAGAAMATHLGDEATAERYREAAKLGAARMDEMLFNGEYYEQRLDGTVDRRYQYGAGCLSDQLFGQLMAHMTGLGYILPENHVKSAIESVFRYNFREDFSDHENVQRTYALNDEAGLLLCSWPRGGMPKIPFIYSDEVWTGVEYQVAAHLIFEGFVEEGLRIVRAVRERYDGVKRDPWNEIECGNHYVRSMASWGLIIAMSGADYDGPAGSLAFAPVTDDTTFRSFFSTGNAWGELVLDERGATVSVVAGELSLTKLTVHHPSLGVLASGRAFVVPAGATARLGNDGLSVADARS